MLYSCPESPLIVVVAIQRKAHTEQQYRKKTNNNEIFKIIYGLKQKSKKKNQTFLRFY